MKIGKYQFKSKEKALKAIDDLGFVLDENGKKVPQHPHTVVHLGYITLVPAEIDEVTKDVIKAAEKSTFYHVDVLWNDLPLDEEGNEIFPKGDWELDVVD